MKKAATLAATLFLTAAMALPAFAQSPAYAVLPGQSYCPALSRYLYRGLGDYRTAGQVSQLQYFLGNYFAAEPVPVTGYYGPITANFVSRFQQQQSVYPITGGVGPLTRAAIARVCNGTVNPPPSQGVSVSSPSAGQTYTHGSSMPITWTGPIRQTFAYEQDSGIVDLYSVVSGKIGTIAIKDGLSGSYTWSIPPFPNSMLCTMQYPNALCGANIPDGQYYIKITDVVGNGFDANATVIGTGQSGTFTITGAGGTTQGVSANPSSGPVPLTTTFTLNGGTYTGTYAVDFGDGTSASLVSGPITHTYSSRGTFTATFQSDIACMHTNPRCMIATMLLGTATVSVY